MVVFLFYGLLANAQVALEDTSPIGTQQDLYVEAYLISHLSPKIDSGRTVDGYCVSLVKKNGYEAYRGNAKEWVKYKNSETPVIGGVVVLDESSWGHLALITDYTTDTISLLEQNYLGRGIVSRRTIPRDYSKILGFVVK